MIKGPYFVFLIVIFLLIFSMGIYADFPQTISVSRGKQVTPIPLQGGMELTVSVSSSMSGTIKITKPSGGTPQSISVQYSQGGFSTQYNFSEVGTYSIQENYTLTANAALLGISESFSGTRTRTYNITSTGNGILKVSSSSISGFSMSLPPGNISVVSINPSSIEPGQSVDVRLRVKDGGIPAGGTLADSVTLSAIWNVSSLEVGVNSPPSVSLNSASQAQTNSDVQISYTLQDADNNLCSISVQYSVDGATWSSATISGQTAGVTPGTWSLSWKATQDQPNANSIYYIRMKANDGITDGNWSNVKSLHLNNVSGPNSPPSVRNLTIKAIDPATNKEPSIFRLPRTGDKIKAVYDFDDPDRDTEKNSKLAWYKDGKLFREVIIQKEDDKILLQKDTNSHQAVFRGEQWYFIVTPNDGKVYGEARQLTTPVTVVNAPPTAKSLQIQPSSPSSNDDLKAVYTYYDPENDPQGSVEIKWYKDSILQSSYNNKTTLPASATSRGDKWYCTVLLSDSLGAKDDEPVKSPVVTVANQKPIIKVVSVSGNTGNITLVYNLTDQDGDRCNLKVWYRFGSGEKRVATVKEATEGKNVITNVAPGEGLQLTWLSREDVPSGYGEYSLGIIPNDGLDDGTEDSSQRFKLDNNDAPIARDVSIFPKSPYSSDNLKADYKFEDPNNGDTESGSRIRWYRNKVEQTNYRDKKEVPSSATKRDEEWYFTIEPSDGKEFGELKQSPTVKILNSPPVASDVKLTPEGATSEDDLKASYKYSDADGDPEVGTQIRWYMNGVLKSEYNDKDTVPSKDTVKGQTWHFTVLVSDGTEPGKLVESNRVKVGNITPVIQKLEVPTDGYKDVKIKFELVDSDNDKCSLVVEYRGGMASNWTQAKIKEPLIDLFPGQITLTWESHKDQEVKQATLFQIRITPSDGLATGKTVESDFIRIDNNAPPVATNLKISPEKPTTADNLTASYDYSDPEGTQESGSEIRWYKGDGIITDFKGKVLSASVTAKGESWYFTVKPRDGAKFGEVVASKPVIIVNTPPQIKKAEILPGVPKSGDILRASYDYRDVDNDRESGTEIQWYKDDKLQLSKTIVSEEDKKMTVPVAKGEKWYIIVKPKDGSDFGQPVTSETVTVQNAAPVVENITISGESGDITINFSLSDGDNDLCDLNVEYQGGSVKTAWTKATIKEETKKIAPGKGLKLTWVSKTDEPSSKASDFRIRITPGDGISTGESAVSLKFMINNNTEPSALNLAILPEMPRSSDDLKISYTFVDPDGDKEGKPEIKWYKNSLVEQLYDNYTVIPSSATTKGDRWHYTIKVSDGKDYGKLQLSPSVTIGNQPPTVSNAKLSPEFPKLEDRLSASYVYFDADKDTEQGTKIEWYKNGKHIEDYDNLMTIPGSATLAGEEWYFVVTPNDGYDKGLPQESNRVYIANLPPSVSSLSISPSNPLTTDDLVASYIYIDPENDPESGSKITWYKNSIPQTKYNDMLRIPSDATARKQIWYFTVTPKDGKQFGAIKQSGFVVIGNTPPKASNAYISPPYPLKSDDLVANYDYFDIDGDLEGRTEIKWYRNGVWVSKHDGLKKLSSKDIQDREVWHFTVRPKDDTDFGEIVVSPSVEVGSPIPRVNNLVIKPENPLTTDNLTVSYVYTDPYGVAESGSQIIWYKNGVAQTEYNNLKTLPYKATSKGEQWYYTVKPSNGALFGEVQKSAVVTIANSPPKLSAVVPQPNNPTTDDNLMVDYVFEDPDGDTEVRNEIKWFRNGVLQPEFEDKTEIPAKYTNRNEEWYFTVRASDGSAFSDLKTSSVVKIGNGKPKVSDLNILPANPRTSDELMIMYKYTDTEDDPESGTEIMWFKNNVNQPDFHNMKSVPASATSKDEKWFCSVTPRDGIDSGQTVTSPIVVIGNTNPEVTELSVSSSKVFRGKIVKVISKAKDVDSIDTLSTDTLSTMKCQLYYKFGNTPWVDLQSRYVELPEPHYEAEFTPDAKALLGDYDFRVKFIDSSGGESDWLERTNLLKVENSPPVIENTADNFIVKEDNVAEFDLTPYGSDFESGKNVLWKLDPKSVDTRLFNAVILRDKILEIIPVDNKNGKSDITLILIDPDGGITEKTDVTIIIDPVNDPPTAPTSVKITPESPKTSDVLICTASCSIDPDNDSVVYRYQWYKNGMIQTDLKTHDVPYVRTAKGDVWRCEVTPSDGLIDGPSASAEITIGNTLPFVTNVKTSGNSKDILIIFDLDDADNDSCELKLEYKVKGGIWKTATISSSLRGIKPAKGLNVTWQSGTDLADMSTDDCMVRITPNDGVSNGETRESTSFILDNKRPEFTVTTVVNPIYRSYINVNVISDEKLANDTVTISAVANGNEMKDLKIEKIGDNAWKSVIELKPGFDGDVLIHVKGTDIVGNVGEKEISEKFKVPGQIPKPSDYALRQNYPNPFNDGTSIPYELPESQYVVIKIYNVMGQLIRTLDEGYKVAGFYIDRDKSAYWDSKDDSGNKVSAGIYFYHFKAGVFEEVRKMIIIK